MNTKTIFVFIVVIIFIAGAVWLFVRKTSEDVVKSPEELLASPSPSISVSTSPVAASPAISAGALPPAGPVQTLPGGLQYQDMVMGTGETAKSGDLVSVNYVGMLTNGTKFDSSYDRGQAFVFPLGAGQVIKGWDMGVAGMKVGGKRKLLIPPALGYGSRGAGASIPPNSTLIFEVELLDLRSGSPQK